VQNYKAESYQHEILLKSVMHVVQADSL